MFDFNFWIKYLIFYIQCIKCIVIVTMKVKVNTFQLICRVKKVRLMSDILFRETRKLCLGGWFFYEVINNKVSIFNKHLYNVTLVEVSNSLKFRGFVLELFCALHCFQNFVRSKVESCKNQSEKALLVKSAYWVLKGNSSNQIKSLQVQRTAEG